VLGAIYRWRTTRLGVVEVVHGRRWVEEAVSRGSDGVRYTVEGSTAAAGDPLPVSVGGRKAAGPAGPQS
jgi:hypothetical protein